MIDGVIITPLRKIPDDRGAVMHMMKATDDGFHGFGEVYCSTVFPEVVKGWHVHDRVFLNYVVLTGMIKFVLHDDRPGSRTEGETQEIYMGEDNYVRVTVPPLVWNGFKGIGTTPAYVVNMINEPHDPNEIRRTDPHSSHIKYSWERKDR